jgi:hypothetical protein
MYFDFAGSNCNRQSLRGSGYLEHNQDGSGDWSASIGVFGMSLSYNGSGGSILQKGTGLMNPVTGQIT